MVAGKTAVEILQARTRISQKEHARCPAESARWASKMGCFCWMQETQKSRLDPWVGKSPWSRAWQLQYSCLEPGHKSLTGYSLLQRVKKTEHICSVLYRTPSGWTSILTATEWFQINCLHRDVWSKQSKWNLKFSNVKGKRCTGFGPQVHITPRPGGGPHGWWSPLVTESHKLRVYMCDPMWLALGPGGSPEPCPGPFHGQTLVFTHSSPSLSLHRRKECEGTPSNGSVFIN